MTNGLRVSTSESSAQINVPPFFAVLVDGAGLPQAATSTAIVAASVETRHRFDLAIDPSITSITSLPGQ